MGSFACSRVRMGGRGRGRVLCMRCLEGVGMIEMEFFVGLVLFECSFS